MDLFNSILSWFNLKKKKECIFLIVWDFNHLNSMSIKCKQIRLKGNNYLNNVKLKIFQWRIIELFLISIIETISVLRSLPKMMYDIRVSRTIVRPSITSNNQVCHPICAHFLIVSSKSKIQISSLLKMMFDIPKCQTL